MDRDELAGILDNMLAGCAFLVDPNGLDDLFAPGRASDDTQIAASQFEQEHGCNFAFDDVTRQYKFVKKPGRWQQLIDNLRKDLGNEDHNASGFRNIDRQIRVAAERAAHCSPATSDETQDHRYHDFLDALRQFLIIYQQLNNSEIWVEALQSVDSPIVRTRMRPN